MPGVEQFEQFCGRAVGCVQEPRDERLVPAGVKGFKIRVRAHAGGSGVLVEESAESVEAIDPFGGR